MLSLKSAFVATAASVPWGMAAPVSTAASSAVRAIIASRADHRQSGDDRNVEIDPESRPGITLSHRENRTEKLPPQCNSRVGSQLLTC